MSNARDTIAAVTNLFDDLLSGCVCPAAAAAALVAIGVPSEDATNAVGAAIKDQQDEPEPKVKRLRDLVRTPNLITISFTDPNEPRGECGLTLDPLAEWAKPEHLIDAGLAALRRALVETVNARRAERGLQTIAVQDHKDQPHREPDGADGTAGPSRATPGVTPPRS